MRIAMLAPIAWRTPPRHYGPFGLSVVEAMACGTPVIAFDRGSMPELIVHGKNGFIVGSLDAAIKAVSAIGKIDRNHCRQHVEKYFTADRMVEEYVEVYNRILRRTIPI
jgi:glycosyltransferase involved in cell wall biosynthesis